MIRFFIIFTLLWPGLAVAQSGDSWRQELGILRMGVVSANRPLTKTKQLEPFRLAVQQALGIPVKLTVMANEKLLVEAMINARIDYAGFSSTAFAATWSLCQCVEPLVAAVTEDGARGFHSALIARASGPSGLSALEGNTIVVPGKHAFAGYLFPRLALKKKGIELDTPAWPIDDQNTMAKAVDEFSRGTGAALLGWLPAIADGEAKPTRGTLFELQNTEGAKAGDYQVLWKSNLLPHGPQTVRAVIPGEVKVILSDLLTGLQQTNSKAYDAIEPVFAGGFRPAALEDYQPVLDALSPGDKNITSTIEQKKSP